MKFSIPQSTLFPALAAVSRSVGIRTTLPVLANVLIQAENDQVKLSVTNLEIGVVKTIKATVLENGEVTVPCRVFVELIGSLTGQTIELEATDEQLKITTPQFKGTLNGISSTEFPAIPLSAERSVSLEANLIAKILSEISFAAASEDGRPTLTGILTEIKKGTLELVATDGFRLAHKKVPLKSEQATDFRVLIPRKSFEEVARLMAEEDELETIILSTSESQNQIIFQINQTWLSSRLIEGQFPSWEKIIPQSSVTKVEIDRAETIQAVKLAAVFAKSSANIIKIQAGTNELMVTSEAKELGNQSVKLPAVITGEMLTVAFNSKFLLDALNATTSQKIKVEFSGNLSPALIRPVDQAALEYVVMPVRLN